MLIHVKKILSISIFSPFQVYFIEIFLRFSVCYASICFTKLAYAVQCYRRQKTANDKRTPILNGSFFETTARNTRRRSKPAGKDRREQKVRGVAWQRTVCAGRAIQRRLVNNDFPSQTKNEPNRLDWLDTLSRPQSERRRGCSNQHRRQALRCWLTMMVTSETGGRTPEVCVYVCVCMRGASTGNSIERTNTAGDANRRTIITRIFVVASLAKMDVNRELSAAPPAAHDEPPLLFSFHATSLFYYHFCRNLLCIRYCFLLTTSVLTLRPETEFWRRTLAKVWEVTPNILPLL